MYSLARALELLIKTKGLPEGMLDETVHASARVTREIVVVSAYRGLYARPVLLLLLLLLVLLLLSFVYAMPHTGRYA